MVWERCSERGLLRGHDGASVREGFSARRRRTGMIPGAFERQSTLSKRIPRDRERPARSDEVESRKLCVGRCSEGESERWSAGRCEVKAGGQR